MSYFDYGRGFDYESHRLLSRTVAACDGQQDGWARARDITTPAQRRRESIAVVAGRLGRLAAAGMLKRAPRNGVWYYQPTAAGRKEAAIPPPAVKPLREALASMIEDTP